METLSRARSLLGNGDADGVLAELDRLPPTAVDTADVLTLRALALLRMGDEASALIFAKRAAGAQPGHRDAHVLLGGILVASSDDEEAAIVIRRGLASNPGCASLWRLRSGIGAAKVPGGTLQDLERAAVIAPADGRIRRLRAARLAEHSARARFAGDIPSAVAAAQRATALDPSFSGGWAARLFANLCREDLSPESAYDDALAAGRAVAIDSSPPRRPLKGRPISLAILSNMLNDSSVWHFLVPLLTRHDPSVLAITLYDEAPHRLPLSGMPVRTVALAGLSPDAVARRMTADRVDVVLDVMGYGQYASRLEVLARRPAPVIVTGIGYPGTLGLDAVGFKLADPLTHPASGSERLHEMPMRLPYMLCFSPPQHAPEPAQRTAGSSLIVGSFNQLGKIGPTCLEAWRRAMEAVPDATLLIKRREIAGREDWFRARFAEHGLPLDRITLESGEHDHRDHLARYAEIDIGLDTYPYNGTTTTCEALWMGVPVVSLVGDRESSRTGLSLLTAAGRPEDATATPVAFAERVRALALDPAGRHHFRSEARRLLRQSPLLDATAYARALEAALLEAVEKAASGHRRSR